MERVGVVEKVAEFPGARSIEFHIICSLNRYVHYFLNPRHDATMQTRQLNNRFSTQAYSCNIWM
jgi:hypothetical protein